MKSIVRVRKTNELRAVFCSIPVRIIDPHVSSTGDLFPDCLDITSRETSMCRSAYPELVTSEHGTTFGAVSGDRKQTPYAFVSWRVADNKSRIDGCEAIMFP